MKVLAFLGSPRVDGNSDILLKEALKVVEESGHNYTLFRPSEMNISPCLNCDGCVDTGRCIIHDEMEEVYVAIREADRFIIASPVFFFGLPAQIKALIDRCQAIWCEKYLLKRPIPSGPHGRKGLLILVGGMKRQVGFDCSNATVTAFFRTISVPEHDVLTYKEVDEKGAILKQPKALKEVYEATKRLLIL